MHTRILDTLTPLVPPGALSAITVRGRQVGFVLTVDAAQKSSLPALEAQCKTALLALPEVEQVHIVTTVHQHQPDAAPPPAAPTRSAMASTPAQLPGVTRIIAVASGKGGVGKSTTTVNLAYAAVAAGLRVGILDADIYGPSIPRMLGLQASGTPELRNGMMHPHHAHGIAAMSVQFITGDAAAILRGPMISKTLQQMLRMTAWGNLDLLLIDMPPGTGDVALSLAQQAPLSGVVLVTTPQEVAVADARKAASMCSKLGVPLCGVVETMSWFEDPAGTRHTLFGSGGGEALARTCGIPLLGQVPLRSSLREASDTGQQDAGAVALYAAVLAQTLAE